MRRIRSFRGGISSSSRQEREQQHRSFAKPLVESLNGRLSEPSTTPAHEPVKGNTSGKSISVTFQVADSPTMVAHGLGYTVTNYRVIRASQPCKVGDSGRRPTRNALWLESDVAPVTVDLVVFGEKHPEPPPSYLRKVGSRRPAS